MTTNSSKTESSTWFYSIATVTVGAVMAVAYQLGLLDRPKFVETTFEPEQLYVIMASTTTKDIGSTVERLLKGTNQAIKNAVDEHEKNNKNSSEELFGLAAAAYGAPVGACGLAVGLYFDDPQTTDAPKWGLGWAVSVANDEEFFQLHKKVIDTSDLSEPIRAVKLVGKNNMKVLKARIPWRCQLTPMIAPILHWSRAFRTYKNGAYTSTSGRETDEGVIACEIYVTGRNDSSEYIDYIVLMGDTTHIFDSMFPL